ncbi:MAG: hypothetical protein U0269_28100 [Polyangiales bacterium]
MTLTDDEVRERFSAFHDGELSPDEAKVVRERIESDATLGAEFEAFKRVMGGLAVLASHASHGSPDGGAQPRVSVVPEVLAQQSAKTEVKSADTSARVSVVAEKSHAKGDAKGDESLVLPEDEQVDLLPDLQATLHKRSGGKFYKNRASRVVGTRPIEAIAAATLVLLLVMYVLMTYVSGLRPAEAPSSGAGTSAH